MKADIFKKIKSGEINNTFPFNLNESNSRQDNLQIKTYEKIMSMKAEGHITGIQRDDNKEGERPNYWHLQVTEDGLRNYAPVKQRLKPTPWELVKNFSLNSIIKFILSHIYIAAIPVVIIIITAIKSFLT